MAPTYLRLIDMRKCLRQVQRILPVVPADLAKNILRTEFICNAVSSTDCDDLAKRDVRRLISRGIAPHSTFNEWADEHNPECKIRFRQMMEMRQAWIDQLCRAINVEIEQQRPAGTKLPIIY